VADSSANLGLREELNRLLSGRSELLVVWLFGSYARSTATDRSDVDLAVLAPGTDRPWFARMRDAWLEKVARQGI